MTIKLIPCGEAFGFLYDPAENQAVLVFKNDPCDASTSKCCSHFGKGWYIMGPDYDVGNSRQGNHLGVLDPLGKSLLTSLAKALTGADNVKFQLNKDTTLPYSWLQLGHEHLPEWS